jgi:P27 family predicted phage terminase small subunit
MPSPKLPPAVAEVTGRREGQDSGGRAINFGPEMGTPDNLTKPDYLSSDASFLWDVLVQDLKGSGVLRSVDSTALAAACETYSRWREAIGLRRMEGITKQNRFGETVRAPWVTVEAEASKQLQSWLREFGLTPSAVTALMQKQPPADQQDDPFDWS